MDPIERAGSRRGRAHSRWYLIPRPVSGRADLTPARLTPNTFAHPNPLPSLVGEGSRRVDAVVFAGTRVSADSSLLGRGVSGSHYASDVDLFLAAAHLGEVVIHLDAKPGFGVAAERFGQPHSHLR